MYTNGLSVEDQKTLLQLLSHLYFPDELEAVPLMQLNILVSHIQEQRPFDNVALDKLLDKTKTLFEKQFSKRLESLEEGRFSGRPDFVQLYEHIGVDAPEPIRDERAPSEAPTEVPRSPTPSVAGTEVPEVVPEPETVPQEESSDEDSGMSSPTPSARPAKGKQKVAKPSAHRTAATSAVLKPLAKMKLDDVSSDSG